MSQGPYNTAGAVFYGNHMATSLALGFLFYGAGSRTFNSSSSSVAALVISLFPRFPLSPSDNRCHLQVADPRIALSSSMKISLPDGNQ